jgi:hypothetical protein
VTVHRLDDCPEARARLRIGDAVQLLVRPDGYLAYRADSADVSDLQAYLNRWLPSVVRQ